MHSALAPGEGEVLSGLPMDDNPLNARPSGSPGYVPPQPGQAAHPQPGVQPPQNAYAPPSFDYTPVETYEEQGNYWLGAVVGFVFALLGLLIIYAAGKPETLRGAKHGFGVRLGLAVTLFLLAFIAAGL